MTTADRPLYNIRRGPHGYQLGKFDRDLNLLAIYDTDAKHCTCPAGTRPTCKHRKMLPRMLARVNTNEFYCYETQTWSRPLAQMADEYRGEPKPPPVDLGVNEERQEPVVPDNWREVVHLANVETTTPVMPSSPRAAAPTSGIRRR